MITKKQLKILLACSLGATLEIYDMALYMVCFLLASSSFFPAGRPEDAVYFSLIALTAGQAMRPLGAIVMAHLGDKYGRKKTMSASIIIMAVCTAGIGMIPSYEYIGILAPILLLVCRLGQGISVGSETAAGYVYITETFPPKYRALFATLANNTAGAVGSIIAFKIGRIVSAEGMPSWAWRVPFLFGIVTGAIGLYVRLKLHETDEFLKFAATKRDMKKIPMIEIFKHYKMPLISYTLIAILLGAIYNNINTYTHLYLAQTVKMDKSLVIYYLGNTFFVGIIVGPLMGLLVTRINKLLTLQILIGFTVIFSYFLFALIKTDNGSLIFLQQWVGFGLYISIHVVFNGMLGDMFPVAVRFSGIAFAYNVGYALIGSFVPYINNLLIKYAGWNEAPCLWVALTALGALIALNNVKGALKTDSQGTLMKAVAG